MREEGRERAHIRLNAQHSTLNTPRRRGLTYIETLIAVLLLSVAVGGMLAGWQISVRAPADKRVTEMGVYCAVSDIERLKAIKYDSLTDTAANTPNVVWYDKWGTYVGTAQGASGFYQVQETISTVVTPAGKTPGTTADLREIRIQVYNTDGTILLEDTRTLITFGGV